MHTTHTLWMAATLLLLPSLNSCQGKSTTTREEVAPVKISTLTVEAEQRHNEHRYSGTVEAANSTALSFTMPGNVQSIGVNVGDRVEAGDLIATIDSSTTASSYKAALSARQQAEDAYARMKTLYEKGSLPEIKWVDIQNKLQQARSLEEIARKNLHDCKLYAPYTGIVAEKSIEVGQTVSPGLPVVKIVSGDRLKVKFSVPENEIADIHPGTRAVVTVGALDNRRFPGVITEKGIVAHPLSRSYEVKVSLDHTDADLMPGMVTEVGIENEKASWQYVVPAQVVQLDEKNRTFVWIEQEGKARKRYIECGPFATDGVTVVSGLENGDRVIVEGRQKVCENIPVTL